MLYMPYLLSREREGACLRRANLILPNDGQVIPIVEPVTSAWINEWKGLSNWLQSGRRALLVVNPYQNEFADKPQTICYADIRQQGLLNETSINEAALIPTLLIHDEMGIESIEAVLSVQDVQAVVHRGMPDSARLSHLLAKRRIEFHVFDVGCTQRSYRRQFHGQARNILMKDSFIKAGSNRDYEEKPYCLHELPYVCASEGADGVSDFLTETADFPDKGGNAPKVAAIHIAYAMEEDMEVWMRHFVGESTDKSRKADYSDNFLLAANPHIWLDSNGCRLLLAALLKQTGAYAPEVKEYSLLHYLEVMHRLCARP